MWNRLNSKMNNSSPQPYSGVLNSVSRRGFTLIELLVVIAIIAILVAIIFPVFAAVTENAREATTMSNMREISTELARYSQDHDGQYPPVLFGYACTQASAAADSAVNSDKEGCCWEVAANGPGTCTTGADTMQSIGSDANATNELVGLFPAYIKDFRTFQCPNNPLDSPSAQTANMNVLQLQSDGSLAVGQKAFFTEDAFDISPQVNTAQKNQLSPNNTPANWAVLNVRYQTSWTSYNQAGGGAACIQPSMPPLDANDPVDSNGCSVDYTRQLRWQNPPASTYVTSVTYHIPNANNIMVLYQGGYVQKLSFQPNPLDPDTGYMDLTGGTSIAVNAFNGTSQVANALIWRYNGTH